jgi:glycosyltransferase involved in cell wall biosynthesis
LKLTVVIPCRNERPFIQQCIAAIFDCALPSDCQLQVFVVDGMSDDGTRTVVEACCAQYPNLNLIDNPKKLTPFAFNQGIYAGGIVDYVQIVGARHILSKNYLQECLNKLQTDPNVWGVGGQIQNESVNEMGRRISAVMSSSFGVGMGNFRTMATSGYTDTVTSPMYPYWVFEKIGFFDEMLVRNQDDDFNFRIAEAGGKLYLIHHISLKYYVRANIGGLRKQYFQYGYWKVFVNQKHGKMTTLRQLFPPLFVAYLASLCLLFLVPTWIQVFYLVPIALYISGLLFFGFKVSQTGQLIQTTLLFPLLHLSYGAGYLLGIFDFLILRKKPSDKQKQLSR